MVSTLEEDLLEIEQTLKAVEQKLQTRSSPTQALSSKVSANNQSLSINKRSFRGINKMSQAPKKSVLLNRNISLSSKKAKANQIQPIVSQSSTANLSLTDDDQSVVQAQKATSLSAQSLVPSVTSIVQGKIKLNAAKLNQLAKANPKVAKQKPQKINNNAKPDYKLKLNKNKKGKLVHKFNNKHAHSLEEADSSNIILVKSYKVKKAIKLNKQKQATQPKSSNKQQIKFNELSSQGRNPHLSVAINKANAKLNPQTQRNNNTTKPKSVIKPPQSKAVLKNHNLKEELIKNALNEVPMNHYHDHDQQKSLKKKYRIKTLRNLSLAAFVLLFGGYMLFLNMPSITFRVAAIQAGMSSTAAIPAYKPAGYSLASRASYGPGYVKIDFKNQNGNKLSLTQEKSSFDSEALKDNVVARADGGYSTYVKDGLTIYLYNNGGASWVNKGQVYNLSGDTSDLSSDEILNMAVSM